MNSLPVKEQLSMRWLSGIFLLFLLTAVYWRMYFLVAIPFLIVLFWYSWKNFYLIFLVLLATLPWSVELNFSGNLSTDFPDELLMLLVSFLFFAHYINAPADDKKEILSHPLMILLFCHLLWIATTVCFSADLMYSVKYFLAKGWYICAFVLAPVLLLRNNKQLASAAIILTASLFFAVLLVFVRHATTGFTFASVNDALVPFFRNHVNYSALLVCGVPVLLAIYKLSAGKLKKNILSFIIVFFLAALFFSYSRGAWMALLAGLPAYWLIKRRLLLTAFAAAVIIALASLLWIKSNDRYLGYAHDYNTTIFHPDFREHFIATYKLKDVSTAERVYRWIAGIRMINDGGLTGYGPATFYSNYRPYAVPAFKTWVSRNEDRSTVHNYFLLLAVEQGIPGLAFFLLLAGCILYYAQMLYHRARDRFYKTVAITTGAIISMLLTVNFLSDLMEADKVGSIFYLCLAVLIIVDRNTRREIPPIANSE